jgi:putative transposase
MTNLVQLEPGKFYHIYNRGNNRENIFIAERNYAYFLGLYAKHIEPVAETFAYCLLRNHFHTFVRIRPEMSGRFSTDYLPGPAASKASQTGSPDNLGRTRQVYTPSQAFSNLFNAYTKSINKAHNRTGSLFEKPFRRTEVTTLEYCMRLVHYIHLNPQKHGFVKDFRDWPYSSYHALLSDHPTHLQREQVLEWFSGRVEFDAVHQLLTDEKSILDLIGDDEG